MAVLACDWLKHIFLLQPLNGIWQNFTGSKYTKSSIKFVFRPDWKIYNGATASDWSSTKVARGSQVRDTRPFWPPVWRTIFVNLYVCGVFVLSLFLFFFLGGGSRYLTQNMNGNQYFVIVYAGCGCRYGDMSHNIRNKHRLPSGKTS